MTDRPDTIDGHRRVCVELDNLLAGAGETELCRDSAGTRWTNEELLFHMVFGYLPPWLNTALVLVLNAGTGPFDWVDHWGSRAASRVYHGGRLVRKLQRTTRALAVSLKKQPEHSWDCRRHFRPAGALLHCSNDRRGCLRLPEVAFDFHARQLSLAP